MRLSENQIRSLLFNYLMGNPEIKLKRWLPAGTDESNWQVVDIGSLGIDNPPLPSAPTEQADKMVLDVKILFHALGGQAGPIKLNGTLGEIAKDLFTNQKGV